MANSRGGEKPNGEPKAVSGQAALAAWRETLRDYACKTWRADGGQPAHQVSERLPELGQMAEEAVSLVETFTLGALARAKRQGGGEAGNPPQEFFDQLNLILNGFEGGVQGQSRRYPSPGRGPA